MERCEILYNIIKEYDSKGDNLWPSKLATMPEVNNAMGYTQAYKHLGYLEERGLVTTAKVKGYKAKPMMSGKRDSTTYEYAHKDSTKIRTWDPNKKLIYIEELATMSDDEKERLFDVLDGIREELRTLNGKKKATTKAEQIESREVKG